MHREKEAQRERELDDTKKSPMNWERGRERERESERERERERERVGARPQLNPQRYRLEAEYPPLTNGDKHETRRSRCSVRLTQTTKRCGRNVYCALTDSTLRVSKVRGEILA
jgi:hypothetical protein